MSKRTQIKLNVNVKSKWSQLYSPWMYVVLAVFVGCEYMLFSWTDGPCGTTSSGVYAFAGLFFAGVFFAMRGLSVLGKTDWRMALLVFLIVFVLFVIPALPIIDYREVARRHWCAQNLQQLGTALQDYQKEHGSLPPAFVADKSGQPMHSWRTLLLPFLEKEKLYKQYNFKQPWNSPKNQKLATETPLLVMKCQSAPYLSPRPINRANYVAVVGEDTLWPTDGSSRSFSEIKKEPSNTALLLEMNTDDLPWHEPRDVKLEDFLSGKVSWGGTEVHSPRHYYTRSFLYEPRSVGRNILFADGSVRFTRGDLTADQIRRLFSITEPFDLNELDRTILPEPRPIVFRHVVFYAWIATLLLQFIYAYVPPKKNPSMQEVLESCKMP